MKVRVLTVCLLVAVSMGSNQAFAATPKVGGACTKIGIKSASLICAKVSGKLKWQVVKKTQKISFTAPFQASVTAKSVGFKFASSAKLSVGAKSLTPTICNIGKLSILIQGIPGLCQISLNQIGNAYFLPAKALVVELKVFGVNVIDFQLPGALLLSQGTYQLTGSATSTLPMSYSSVTDTICSVADSVLTPLQPGTCTVVANQSGADFYPAADPVSRSVEISTDRVTGDLPDVVSGFQIKAVYVVPSDGTDNAYDTNGYISGILDEGNSYLNSQIGRTLPIDSTSSGYDIEFLKSQYSTDYLRTHAQAADLTTTDSQVLMAEIKAMENPGENRKDYIFFIDVPGFAGPFCGMADRPGLSAVVALQNISDQLVCKGPAAPFFDNYTSKTWVHELLHNFGVSHTLDDPCDLMAGSPETLGTCTSTVKFTMDKERTHYVGASTQGPDVLTLRVWQGHTDDQSLQADCIINQVARADGLQYAYCPTGTQSIGALTYCWSGITSSSLEELNNGSWVSIGVGSASAQPWGTRLTWKCHNPGYLAPWTSLTVNTAGIRHYRWIVNGEVAEEFNVIWVK